MLSYERVNDTERLTRTRSTENNRATERVDDIDPTLVHLPFPIVYHRYVYRVVVIGKHFRLLEGLILEIETVITNLIVVILGDAIQSLMHQHGTYHRTYGIENTIGRESHPTHSEVHLVKEETKSDKGQSD